MTLKTIDQILQKVGLDSTYEETPPFDKILIYLGQDHKDRERIMTVTAQEQQLMEPDATLTRVQFEVPLPFKTRPATTPDTASLLFYLNRLTELPGFELDEIHDTVYYRYVLMVPISGIEQTLIQGIIGVILMLLDMFSQVIEEVTEGKLTFNAFLEKIVETAEAK